MLKTLFILAAIGGATAVMIGAFGAHSLKAKLSPEQLQVFETGVKYQFYHVLAMMAVGLLFIKYPSSLFIYSGIAFFTGILLFSGSLYLLSCKELLNFQNVNWLGPVTPVGGFGFIIGWILLLIGAAKI